MMITCSWFNLKHTVNELPTGFPLFRFLQSLQHFAHFRILIYLNYHSFCLPFYPDNPLLSLELSLFSLSHSLEQPFFSLLPLYQLVHKTVFNTRFCTLCKSFTSFQNGFSVSVKFLRYFVRPTTGS